MTVRRVVEGLFQQIRPVSHPRVHAQPIDHFLLARIVDLQAGRNPDEAREPAPLAALDGQLVLDLDERGRGAFGREAVAIADQVDRHRAARQIFAHRRFHLGANRRQRRAGSTV